MSDSGDLELDILKRLRPKLVEIFLAFGISPTMAEAILTDVVSMLACRWPAIECPDRWIVLMVTSRCIRLREERQIEDPPQR